MNKNDNDEFSDDEIKAEDLIKKTFLESNPVDIAKGDKIKVIKGDLTGISGTVITIEDN